jgi:hypothetical protein
MKRLLLLFLAFALGSAADAGPLDWAKHHKRFLLMEGAAVAGASIHAAGLHHCRKTNGVEPCDLHYGTAWANFGIVAGLNVIVMPSVAESCWKDGQGKFCYIFAYGGSAAQGVWGLHEASIRRNNETHVDLSGVVFVRH